MQYDYDFLYRMRGSLNHLRFLAQSGADMVAHSVMEELLIYLCTEESAALMELYAADSGINEYEPATSTGWIFDLFDDMDVIYWLYSQAYLEPDHTYHFSNWFEQQFYMDDEN